MSKENVKGDFIKSKLGKIRIWFFLAQRSNPDPYFSRGSDPGSG